MMDDMEKPAPKRKKRLSEVYKRALEGQWKAANGEILLIESMDSQYIKNIIRWLNKNGKDLEVQEILEQELAFRNGIKVALQNLFIKEEPEKEDPECKQIPLF